MRSSAIARDRPPNRLLRILNRVYAAPTSMPPTAIGRTTNFHTGTTRPIQSSPVAPAGSMACSCGPSRKMRSGTNSPQAKTPPEKLSAASSGPMM